ncbi:choline BCCT transporter BetT [Actinomyces sp. MRS3W]|uniref:choline BCCT transporter BetT n=1 Tax=Actinomyces sp. MRS3W TaxID=2800796 RepID=UPI0028FD0917|nr:choline BCCT transporter BetT [Actinomyces sp. MRS3W]MDU0349782.1 choline BCCT transporter BetT [Actinomyces sp. MRS3W]
MPDSPSDQPVQTAPEPSGRRHLNVMVFAVSAAIIAAIAGAAIVAPETVSAAFSTAVSWAGRWFGSFYILLVTAAVVFVVVLALSKFGSIRLGPDNSTPDFSTFSWAAMLFAAGVGTGIMFYAVAEPVAQYMAPPTGEGQTVEAARNGIVLTLLHYGISGWGLYSIVGMALGYFAYRRHQPLAVRSTLRPLLGDKVNGRLGDVVDAAALVGGAVGIAASLGVGVVQLNVALTLLFGLPQGTSTQIGLIALSVIMATVSAVSGVDRGVRILSNINVLLAVGLAVWVLVTGNTAFLIDALVGNIGDFITQFPGLTLETYAYDRPTEWLNSWTLFFWAWWITWAAFVGMFLARISRGRTVREFVVGSLVLPFSYVMMWVSIFGNSALDLIRSGNLEFAELTVAEPEQGLYMLLGHLPGGTILIALALFIGILFYVTSADSGALVMANLSSRADPAYHGDPQDAPAWLRIFWATLTGVLTIAMLVAGGIPILQQATIVMALPFSFVIIAVMAGLWRAMRTEASREQARGIANRNRLLGATGTAAGMNRIPWRDRLSHTFDIVSPARAQRAMSNRVVPALEAVADELRKEDMTADVVVEGPETQDPDDLRNFLGSATLVVTPPPSVMETVQTQGGEQVASSRFRYAVRMVQAPVPAFGVVVHEADDLTVRLEVRPRGGGQGYDVMDWSREQVAHDVLDHYERWLEYLGAAETV